MVLALATNEARAYEINPYDPVHETMSVYSAMCFERAAGQEPSNCAGILGAYEERKRHYTRTIAGLSIGGRVVTVGELAESTRWPDDPQRKIGGIAVLNFGVGMKLYCRRYDESTIDEAGLLCSSHFGDLQFVHSMASETHELTATTEARILDWAKFAYDYAAGFIDEEATRLNRPATMCEVMSRYPAIEEQLAIKGSFICKQQQEVGWFFGYKCKNPIRSGKCNILDNRTARLAALGALLHLVQDSFSLSHVDRGDCTGVSNRKPSAAIRLNPVTQYYNYRSQRPRRHGKSDGWPAWPAGRSPGGSEIHSPLLAGAWILNAVAKHEKPDEVVKYLRDHVFKPADNQASKTGSGKCYAR